MAWSVRKMNQNMNMNRINILKQHKTPDLDAENCGNGVGSHDGVDV